LLQEFVNRVSHLQGNTLSVLTDESVTLQQVLLLRRLQQAGRSTPSELAGLMRSGRGQGRQNRFDKPTERPPGRTRTVSGTFHVEAQYPIPVPITQPAMTSLCQ
jgi:hypothetical protein